MTLRLHLGANIGAWTKSLLQSNGISQQEQHYYQVSLLSTCYEPGTELSSLLIKSGMGKAVDMTRPRGTIPLYLWSCKTQETSYLLP